MHKLRCGKIFIAALALGPTFFSVPVASQQRSASLRANDTELLMLGTAGGPPLRKDRSEPATLLIVDGRPYLIDCGIGTIRRLVEVGIPSETIDASLRFYEYVLGFDRSMTFPEQSPFMFATVTSGRSRSSSVTARP